MLLGVNSFAKFYNQSEVQIALNTLRKIHNDIDYIVTHTLPLEDFTEGVDLFTNKEISHALKIVFTP